MEGVVDSFTKAKAYVAATRKEDSIYLKTAEAGGSIPASPFVP